MVIAANMTDTENARVESQPRKTGQITPGEVENYLKGVSTTRSLYILERNGQPPVIVALTPVTTDPAKALRLLSDLPAQTK